MVRVEAYRLLGVQRVVATEVVSLGCDRGLPLLRCPAKRTDALLIQGIKPGVKTASNIAILKYLEGQWPPCLVQGM
jgi:hypothetical protein